MSAYSPTSIQSRNARLTSYGPGDSSPPDDDADEVARDAILDDVDEAARYISEEAPAAMCTLLGRLLVHGIPSNRAGQSGWADQYWCQIDDALTELNNGFSDWALKQARDNHKAMRDETAEARAFNDVEWML